MLLSLFCLANIVRGCRLMPRCLCRGLGLVLGLVLCQRTQAILQRLCVIFKETGQIILPFQPGGRGRIQKFHGLVRQRHDPGQNDDVAEANDDGDDDDDFVDDDDDDDDDDLTTIVIITIFVIILITMIL